MLKKTLTPKTRFQFLVAAFLVAAVGFSSTLCFGEVLHGTISNSQSKDQESIEIFAGTIQLLESHRTSWEWIQNLLSKGGNKKTQIVSVFVNEQNNVTPKSLEELKKTTSKAKRWTYSVTRFVLNGVTVGSNLMIAYNMPATVAFSIGAFVGGMSGTIMYYNSTFQKFTNNSALSDWLAVRFKKLPVESLKGAESFLRWGVVDAVFIGLFTIALHSTGYQQSVSVLAMARIIIETTVAEVASQGLLEVGIGKETVWLKEKTKNLAEQSAIQNKSDLATMLVSALSVAMVVLDGHPGWTIGKVGFGAMAAGGMVNYFRVYRKLKQSPSKETCRDLLSFSFVQNLTSLA